MGGTAEGRTSRERMAAAVALAVSIALALAAVLSVDYLPTHDGPQHIYTVHAKLHLDDPATGYGRWLEAGHPLTAQGFALVFGPLDAWLGWRAAYAASLAILLLGWIGGAALLAWRLAPERLWLGIALGGAAFSWALYMGFFSFYLSQAVGLWVIAFAVGCRFERNLERMLLAAILLFQGWLHVFPAVLTAAIALLVCVARAPQGERASAFARAVAVGLPLAGLALLIVLGRGEQSELLGRDDASWESRWAGIALGAKAIIGGPAWRAYGIVVLWVGLLIATLVRFREQVSPREFVLLASAVALGAAGFLLPLHLIGWDFFSVRFLPLAIACGVVAFPMERLAKQPRAALAAVCCAGALASHAWALGYNQHLDALARPALAALDAPIERRGPRLAVVMDPGLAAVDDPRSAAMPFAVPLLNLGQIYATAQGGFPADTFAISAATHQVLIRDDAPAFPPYPDRSFVFALAREEAGGAREARAKFASYAASFAAGFEDVVWFGRPEDHALLEARGFRFDHREGDLAVARFVGCPLAVDLNRAAPGPTEIELGWYPLLESRERHHLPADVAGRIELHDAPCGPVWLRVRDARDLHAGGAACRGADPEGRLVLRDARATPVVRCDLDAS